MRRVLIGACVMLMMSTISSAQLKMEAGVKAGLNLAGLGLSSDGKLSGANYNGRTGFHLGAYGLVRKGKLGIQPEITYSQQGQRYNTANYSSLRTDLSYINIPVIVKYYPMNRVSLQFGPQIGFLLSAKGDLVQTFYTNGTSSLGPAILNQDLKPYLNGTDFSLVFGVGIDLPWDLNFAFRYNYGVSNINKYQGGGNEAPSFSTAYTQNQVIQISVSKKLYKLGK